MHPIARLLCRRFKDEASEQVKNTLVSEATSEYDGLLGTNMINKFILDHPTFATSITHMRLSAVISNEAERCSAIQVRKCLLLSFLADWVHETKKTLVEYTGLQSVQFKLLVKCAPQNKPSGCQHPTQDDAAPDKQLRLALNRLAKIDTFTLVEVRKPIEEDWDGTPSDKHKRVDSP